MPPCEAKDVPSEVKPRYISLAPSTTEILFALGLDEEIIGVSSYCDFPQKAKTKEKVGDFSQPSMERILVLKPDYIFCTGLEQAPVVAALKRLNLNVYVSDPLNIRELLDSILEIGVITHREYAAQILCKSIEERVEVMRKKVELIPLEKRPKVFLEIWNNPLTTAGSGTFVDELISFAGGANIASDTKRPYSFYSPEEVIKQNPDCIILAYMSNEKPQKLLAERIGWSEIAAVKNKRVYSDIDSSLLLRPGPRVIEGIEELHKRLYQ